MTATSCARPRNRSTSYSRAAIRTRTCCRAPSRSVRRSADRDGRWSRVAFALSAVCFGWAIAFKQFAVLVLPPVVRWVAVRDGDWKRYALIVAGVVAAFVAPFFVQDPGAFVEKQIAAPTLHDEVLIANTLRTLTKYSDGTTLVPMFMIISHAGTLGLAVLAGRWDVQTID